MMTPEPLPPRVFVTFEMKDGGHRMTISRSPSAVMKEGALTTRGLVGVDPLVIDIPAPMTPLPDVSLPDAYALGILAGVRSKYLACAGAKPGDRLLITPADDLPAGYAVLGGNCKNAGFVRIYYQGPQLAIGVSNSLPLKVSAFR